MVIKNEKLTATGNQQPLMMPETAKFFEHNMMSEGGADYISPPGLAREVTTKICIICQNNPIR